MMVLFPVDIPLPFIPSRCRNSGISERDTRIYDKREWILDTDRPRKSRSIQSMGIYIPSRIHEKIIVPKGQENCGSHIHCVSFGDTTEIEKLIFPEGNNIRSDKHFLKICIDYPLGFLKFSIRKRVTISESGNLHEWVK